MRPRFVVVKIGASNALNVLDTHTWKNVWPDQYQNCWNMRSAKRVAKILNRSHERGENPPPIGMKP